MRRSFFSSLFIAAQLLLAAHTATAAINGTDDFDDNVKDEAKWGPDRTTGNGTLTETGQHLEYGATGASFTRFAYRPWRLNSATYDTNWEVVLDLNNSCTPANSTAASIGLEVFAPFTSLTKSAFFEFYASKGGSTSPVERGFSTYLVDGETYSGGTTQVTTSTSASIRITFNAVTKVLTLYRDADGPAGGYTWVRQTSYGIAGSGGNTNAQWNLSGSDEMLVYIYGYSENFAPQAGTVYADNFSATSGTSATVTAPTNVTSSTATLHGTVFPNGLDTTVVFEVGTDEEFLEKEDTAPQVIPGTASTTAVTGLATDLAPNLTYWVRIRATNSSGQFFSNVIVLNLPPYTLSIDPTYGTVTRTPDLVEYESGATVTLTAVPPAGSTFIGWAGDLTGTQNPATITMTTDKHVIANFTVPIAQAADTTGLTFTTGGSAPWYGQTAVSHDGVDSVRSGAIADGQSSWFQTMVTGPGQISFWVRVSSESADVFEFFIDNVQQGDGLGGAIDWQKRTYTLTPGTHTLRWQYRKDIIFFGGADAAWVDEITFTPTLTFAAWRTSKFTSAELADQSISGPNADPDGDGIPNLLEFALGGQPKDPGSRPKPDFQVESIDGQQYLTLTVTKPSDVTGLTYTPQAGATLSSWNGSPEVVTLVNSATTLKVRDSVPMSSGGKRFLRLSVTSN